MKKGTFDLIFIIVSTGILLVINHYGFIEKYKAFSLIPILVTYFLGQFSERKFRIEIKDKTESPK
jgi:TctA family transporter